MKILICGDVVGRSGRKVIEEKIPILRRKEKLKFVIINGENAASGFGITKKICNSFYQSGVDVISSGNHIWDQKEVLSFINEDERLLRPQNFPENCPGKGYGIYRIEGRNIVVINILCRLFMDTVDDPFRILENTINKINDRYKDSITIVDVHGEATSEKMAIGHFLDGKVSAVVGSHTHIPTADLHLMKKGTFFQADLGMCGDYDSVVGMKKEISLSRFLNKHIRYRLETANGEGSLCGTIIEIEDNSNKVKDYKQILTGGVYKNNGWSL